MSAAAIKIPLNIGLAFQLAVRSLKHRKMIALATLLGVAIGVGVVNAVLIVDANTARGYEAEANAETENAGPEQAAKTACQQQVGAKTFSIRIERIRNGEVERSIVPTQRGSAGRIKAADSTRARPGEEDYQAMRLAARMASLLAFFIGAVIVFYTMRYSVSTRAREFSLMLCLGESRRNVGASLMAEASLLGALGTAVGLIVAFPAAAALLAAGVSTNGRRPLPGFEIPWFELSGMGLISLVIVYLGVASPLREIHRISIPDVLQPRFLSNGERDVQMAQRGFGWLIPPMLAAGWIGMRPFMESWLSVVYFFLFEAAFVGLLAVATLWWLSPFLRGTIRVFETLFRAVLPLETLLTGRRMRLNSKRLVFSVTGVTLVFSLLTGLHDVTRALKDEVSIWAWRAMGSSSYLERPEGREVNEDALQARLATYGIALTRMSAKTGGVFPVRLIRGGNPIFADNLEKSLGQYASARPFGGVRPYLSQAQEAALYPWYVTVKRGRYQAYWQSREIDRDFLIFDFILFGTVILAGIGVANTMLIQVRARDREFAVLKSIGISRGQVARMLLIEGTIIGCVSAALAVVIGNGLGAISVRFLDHFTLFDYALRISLPATLYISALCVLTCVIASIYPAFIANRASSAESLHYE
jgi:ABC-type lipoprotein release transport system permease subunit